MSDTDQKNASNTQAAANQDAGSVAEAPPTGGNAAERNDGTASLKSGSKRDHASNHAPSRAKTMRDSFRDRLQGLRETINSAANGDRQALGSALHGLVDVLHSGVGEDSTEDHLKAAMRAKGDKKAAAEALEQAAQSRSKEQAEAGPAEGTDEVAFAIHAGLMAAQAGDIRTMRKHVQDALDALGDE